MEVTRATEEAIKVWIALGGVALALLWSSIPKAKARDALLIGFAVMACLNYVRYDFSRFRNPDAYDLLHYYMASRYFDEVGYFDLYPAMLLVDTENGPYNPDLERVRLTTREGGYARRPLGEALERGRRIREERFTPERWESFERDILFLQRHTQFPHSSWRDLTDDRGFNGTPTWLMMARPLAELVPAPRIRILCLIDIFLLAIAMLLLVRAYDWRVMAWTLAFLATTYSWRWTVPGIVFMRHDWFCAILIAMSLIRLGHPVWAGALTGYAGLMRIFPAVWLYGQCAKAAAIVFKDRKIVWPQHRTVLVTLAGCAACVVVLEGTTALVVGVDEIRAHAEKLTEHISVDELSSRRVGFAIGYGHHWRLRPTHITEERKHEIAAAATERMAIAAIILLALAYALRRSRDDEAYAYGFFPFFLLSTASYYYYSARATMVVAHAADLEKLRNRVGLAALFGIEVFCNWAETKHHGHRMFLVGGLSQLLFAYVLVMTGWLIYDLRRADALEAGAGPKAEKATADAPETAPAQGEAAKRKTGKKRKRAKA